MARPRLGSNGKQPEELPKVKITRETLKEFNTLFSFVKPYRAYFAAGLIFLFLSSLATMAFPYITGNLLDSAISGTSTGFLGDINSIALALMGILVVQAFLSFFRIKLFAIVGEKSLADMRKAVYERIIRLPMNFFANRRVGELSSRITADLSQIQDTVTTVLAEFLRQLSTLIVGVILIIGISGKLTLIMISVFPLLIIAAVWFGKKVRKLAREAQDQLADTGVIVEETLQAISNVKAFTNENFETNRYKSSMAKVVALALRNANYRGAFSSFIIFSLFGSIVLIIWQGSMMIQAGELSFGNLTSFIIYTMFIGGSVGGFADQYAQIQKTLGATQRVREILKEKIEPEGINPDQEIIAKPINTSIEKLSGNIQFNSVSFHYPSRKDIEVIKNLSFEVKSGEQIAIVGPSGAGKSTLVSLLMRFYDPQGGEILFDSTPHTEIDLNKLRSNIGIVPQDVQLFGGTIKDNIKYGNPEANDEEIMSAAKRANAHEFIMGFPEQYDTIVGERGVKLSGGQRQRIAIARALLKNPSILILDEATSSLDSESERLVQEALDELMKGRTSIVIAHRLSTVKNANKILVLQNGTLTEWGTHNQLLEIENGMYKYLLSLQQQNQTAVYDIKNN